MSTETSDLFRRLVDAFNKHDAAAFAACYAPDAVVNDPQFPEPLRGTAAIRKDIAEWAVAFPDVTSSMSRTVVNGTTYACEWSMTGTHKGPLTGPGGHVPATNRPIDVKVATIGRIDSSGRIVEESRYYDLAGLMGQLGLMQ